ncbi:uncharacterized protein N7459_000480 [Penicillium hispanicum]|uniref:uncharacterized protein n=1 Tax=Penicillium hispanicum TaxID=1080232 RepID=UPI00254055A0|nr:uncharacterized protein N7459_000480 [Penicillium hispanicum]KAJ5594272.1 hypothetical protein N7459_000480 [Penicillium hispanicum]
MSSGKPRTAYFSNGQALQSPPLTVRLTRFFEGVYVFVGLYLVSLFSLDPYTAAQNSQFNIHRPKTSGSNPRWGGPGSYGPGGGGGGGGGSGPGSGPGRRIGRVDDIRGPDALNSRRESKMSSVSPVPSTDEEWERLFSELKVKLPERSLSQPAIPLDIPRLIDHTLLVQPATPEQIDQLCDEARELHFASVCVRPEHVARAAAQLKDIPSTVVSCVVAFPEGIQATSEKVREAQEAVSQGASEIDVVINYPLLKEGYYKAVYDDIDAVRKATPFPVKVKAIVECSQLNRDQLIAATVLCCKAECDFVKTSTGFTGPGACVSSVTTMRLVAEIYFDACKVKASGGLRSASDCMRMIKAGATRIGTSAGVNIVKELDEGEVLEQGASHAVT